jgi:hypothetical protein
MGLAGPQRSTSIVDGHAGLTGDGGLLGGPGGSPPPGGQQEEEAKSDKVTYR